MTRIENDLTKGAVHKKLILFALPFLASNVVQSLYMVADMIIIGRFSGHESMSGINIGGNITFILTHTVIGLCMGGTVLIGQYMGAGNREALKRAITTLITLLAVLSVAITAMMLLLTKPILHLVRTPAESFVESERYLTVSLWGLIFIFGYNALAAILRGMGNSKQPLIFVTIACVVNIILNFIFVAGLGWGAFGAAFTTVVSQALSVLLCIRYMIKNNFQFDFKLRSYKIYREEAKLIFRIGFPTCIQNSVISLSFAFIMTVVNVVGGVTASAGVAAAARLNNFAFMPLFAISASISAMTAQNFGAGRIDRAVSALKIGTVFSVCLSLAYFALITAFPHVALRIFGDNPQMVEDGVAFMRSFAWDFFLIPFVFCINGFLIGGGHTVFTLICSVLSSLLLRVPVSYFLGVTLGWGLWGIGFGAPVASFGTLIVIAFYMLRGNWKKNVIKHEKTTS